MKKVQSFLQQEGYRLPEAGEAPDVGNMLTQLSRKLCCSAEFPHEIGVFLGYPLGDVVGFIENRGKNFTCCGCWKSYGDPDAAQKHFDQLSKCTAVYLRLFHSVRWQTQYPHLSGVYRYAGIASGLKQKGGRVCHGSWSGNKLSDQSVQQI